jgi:hypothetical protein
MLRHEQPTKIVAFAALALSLIVVATSVSRPADTKADIETEVRQFVAAFNARNIESMLAIVDEKVQWLNVDGARVTIEVEGKNALREKMGRYFRSCPSCKSSLDWVRGSGSRVTAIERATWTGRSGLKSQRSLSVYEFRNGKILRVYYFPAEPESPEGP